MPADSAIFSLLSPAVMYPALKPLLITITSDEPNMTAPVDTQDYNYILSCEFILTIKI